MSWYRYAYRNAALSCDSIAMPIYLHLVPIYWHLVPIYWHLPPWAVQGVCTCLDTQRCLRGVYKGEGVEADRARLTERAFCLA